MKKWKEKKDKELKQKMDNIGDLEIQWKEQQEKLNE